MRANRKVIFFVVIGGLFSLLAIAGATLIIRRAAQGRTYRSVTAIPHRRVGLLLGCGKTLANGRENLYFRNRILAAAALLRAEKIDYLIVSGDNRTRAHDETTDMKNSLVKLGVPADRIYGDYAGFRTLDSVVRAKEIFGQTELTVISQKFHNERAIFIARRRGIDAVGFDAADVDAYAGFKTNCREQLARVRTVLDVLLLRTRPKYLGPKIMIGEPPVAADGPR
jgi:SanA protein